MPILKRTDIVEKGDPFEEAKKSALEFDKIIKKVTKSNKDFATALQLVKKSGDGEEAKKLTQATDKLRKSTIKLKEAKTVQVRVNEQLLRANKRLAESRTQEAKQLALVRERTRQQNKALREQAREQLKVKKGLGGITKQILGAAGIVSGFDLLIQGITTTIKKSNDLIKINKKVQTSFKVTGKEARNMSASILALSTTFEEDYNEILQAANVVSKEFGITGGQALDLIEEGFKKGSNNSGEFLDILKEYPTQLQSIGLNAEESFAIINQQVTAGVYSDKGIDALKEAGIRLRENTKAVQQSLSVFSKDTQEQIKNAVARGEVFEATQLISAGLKDNSLTAQEVQTVISNVFGGAGEDAMSFVMNLDNLKTSLEDVEEQTTDVQNANLKLSETWNNVVAGFSDSEGFFSKFWAGLLDGVNDWLGGLEDLSVWMNEGWDAAVARFNARAGKVGQQLTGLRKRTTLLRGQTDELEKSAQRLIDANGNLVDGNGKIIKTSEQLRKEYELRIAKEKELEELEKERTRRAGIAEENQQLQTITTNFQATGVTGGFDPVKSSEEITKEVNAAIEKENNNRRERELEAEKEQALLIKGIKETAITEATQFATDIFNQSQDDRLARTLSDIEAEKIAAEDQLKKGEISKIDFNRKIAELNKKARIEEGRAEKRKALFDIGINTAVAAVKALPNFIKVAAVVAAGAIQAGLVAARPLPGFKDGVIGFKGKGTGTSDSNLAKISNGESVITAKGTENAPGTLDAINKGLLTDRDLTRGMRKTQKDSLLASLLMQGNAKSDEMITALMNLASTEDYGGYIRVTKGSGQTSIHNKG